MYRCIECGTIFEEPYIYYETHGLDTPPYEEMRVCPVCEGDFDEVVECEVCGSIVWKSTALNMAFPKRPPLYYCFPCYDKSEEETSIE